jgi:hypothetical protein
MEAGGMKLAPGIAWEIVIEMVSPTEVDFIINARKGNDRMEMQRRRLRAKKGETPIGLEARAWRRLINISDKQLEELGLATVGDGVSSTVGMESLGLGPGDDGR